MPSQITLNIPAIPVVEPDTTLNSPVVVEAITGSSSRNVSLPALVHNGNEPRDLQVTVSNVVGGAVSSVKLVNGTTIVEGVSLTQTITAVQPQETVNASVAFTFTSSTTAGQVTATVTSEWV